MHVISVHDIRGRGQVVLLGNVPTALSVGWCVRTQDGGSIWEIVGKETPGGRREAAVTLRKLTGKDVEKGDNLQVDLGAMVIRKKARKLKVFLSQLTPTMRAKFLNSVLRDFCHYCGDEIVDVCHCMNDE